MNDKKPELFYGAQIRHNLIRVSIGVFIIYVVYLLITSVSDKDMEVLSTQPSVMPTQKSVIVLDPTAKPLIEPAVLGL